jgi:hypothetical protein
MLNVLTADGYISSSTNESNMTKGAIIPQITSITNEGIMTISFSNAIDIPTEY